MIPPGPAGLHPGSQKWWRYRGLMRGVLQNPDLLAQSHGGTTTAIDHHAPSTSWFLDTIAKGWKRSASAAPPAKKSRPQQRNGEVGGGGGEPSLIERSRGSLVKA